MEREKGPYRLGQRAGEMGDRSVGGDNQVQIGDQGGGVGVIENLGGVIDQLKPRRRKRVGRRVFLKITFLKAEKLTPGISASGANADGGSSGVVVVV